jgi:hypothetical protein
VNIVGIVPANGDVDITITFAPTEFSTARMVLQLVVSQFNSSPLTCTVLGNSIPGHARYIFLYELINTTKLKISFGYYLKSIFLLMGECINLRSLC